jgi:hypothetical protein
MRALSLRSILILLLVCCLNAVAVRAATPDWGQPVFGVVDGFARPGEAAALGAGWERVIFHWNLIQPNPETFNTGAVPEAAIGGGRQVVGLVKTAPPWATTSGVPNGLELPYDDPANVFGAFVTQLVSHYSGRVAGAAGVA